MVVQLQVGVFVCPAHPSQLWCSTLIESAHLLTNHDAHDADDDAHYDGDSDDDDDAHFDGDNDNDDDAVTEPEKKRQCERNIVSS